MVDTSEITLPDLLGPENIEANEEFLIAPLIQTIDQFQRAQLNDYLFPDGEVDEAIQDESFFDPEAPDSQLFEYDTDTDNKDEAEARLTIPPPPTFIHRDTEAKALEAI